MMVEGLICFQDNALNVKPVNTNMQTRVHSIICSQCVSVVLYFPPRMPVQLDMMIVDAQMDITKPDILW